jgi:hypothetical protein
MIERGQHAIPSQQQVSTIPLVGVTVQAGIGVSRSVIAVKVHRDSVPNASRISNRARHFKEGIMGRIIVVTTLVLVASTGVTQEAETLLSPGISNGGFGAVVTKLTTVNGEFGVMAGLRGAWITNHTFSIGAGFYGLATQNIVMDGSELGGTPGQDYFLEMGYAGVEVEYVYPWHRLLHMSANVLVGGGGVAYIEDPHYDDREDDPLDSDAFFIVEPGLYLELNVARPMRLDLGLSYRFVADVELPKIEDGDLEGLAATLTLKFGGF